MAIAMPTKVADGDVFALTESGKAQLGDARSTLTKEALELLVVIDGKLSVAELARLVPGMKPGEACDWFGALLEGGFISRAKGHEALDVLDFVSSSDKGLALLQRHGYYVRIARPPQALRPRRAGARRTALVVDDDPDICRLLAMYLRLEDIDVVTAASGAEVVAAMRRPAPFDLVLLDVQLPDVDGFIILAKMREHPVLKDVPVIMLTASATRAAVLKGLQLGADGYVTKPFQQDQLIKALHTVLGLAEPAIAA